MFKLFKIEPIYQAKKFKVSPFTKVTSIIRVQYETLKKLRTKDVDPSAMIGFRVQGLGFGHGPHVESIPEDLWTYGCRCRKISPIRIECPSQSSSLLVRTVWGGPYNKDPTI